MPIDAPGSDEIEVSIFGPGKGEAVAVHLGNGDWITVDSCRDVVTGTHPVLRYFDEIGVDVASQVHRVVGTHSHDDHINGMGELFSAAKSAKFVSSSAIHSREFFATVEADEDIERQTGVKVRAEYRAILEEVERRGRDMAGLRPLMRALEQLPIWARAASDDASAARVLSLSPSHEAVSRALEALAEGTATAGKRKRLSAADPNELAVALWVEVGDVAILLGADLLNGPAGCGWEAVLATHTVDFKASIFKVPHHGSPTSHHEGVWTDMLTDKPTSLLAPYRSGKRPLPDPDDVARILSFSNDAYISAGIKMPATPANVKRSRSKLMGIASNIREPVGRCGHVQARRAAGATQWSVDVFHPAQRLS